jgi:plastocyanin
MKKAKNKSDNNSKNKHNNAKMKVFFAIAFIVIVVGLVILFTGKEKNISNPISNDKEDIIESEKPIDTIKSDVPETKVPETEIISPKPADKYPIKPVHIIEIKNFKFEPRTIEIKKGETVKWVNLDIVGDNHVRTHMIKQAYTFISPRLDLNETFEYTYDEVGEFKYIDGIFSTAMNGKVIVTE